MNETPSGSKASHREEPHRHAVFTSEEPCWHCRQPLLLIDPPYHGWQYWCPACHHMTCPESSLRQHVSEASPEAIGVVAAIPVTFTFIPTPEPAKAGRE